MTIKRQAQQIIDRFKVEHPKYAKFSLSPKNIEFRLRHNSHAACQIGYELFFCLTDRGYEIYCEKVKRTSLVGRIELPSGEETHDEPTS